MTRARKRKFAVIFGALAVIAIAACTLTLSLGDGERRTVAGELVTDVIVPTYDEVVVRANDLRTATNAFAAASTIESLRTMREAWRAARLPWKETDAFRFGPMALQSLGVAMDQFPVDPTKIEMEIAGAQPIDAAYFATLGANKKGFHAIEYLIFDGAGAGDTAVLASLTDARRLAFVVGAADDLATNAAALRDAWSAYASVLADPGSDNDDYPTIKASIDALVNECVFQAEVVADTRIGTPLGVTAGSTGQPNPALQESGPSENSIIDMISTLRGIRNIYLGSRLGEPRGGISQLVAAQSPAVDRNVRAALDDAFAAVVAIPMPYSAAILAQDARVLAAYTAVQELQSILATEVIATLGATLKFNDNDGD